MQRGRQTAQELTVAWIVWIILVTPVLGQFFIVADMLLLQYENQQTVLTTEIVPVFVLIKETGCSAFAEWAGFFL